MVALFADLDPDDHVWLIDELPATVAQRLLQGLPDDERRLTAAILGYKHESIGRRMSPEYVVTHPQNSVGTTLAAVRQRVADAETVYTLPVVDEERRVIGVVSLRDLLGGADDDLVETLMVPAHTAAATRASWNVRTPRTSPAKAVSSRSSAHTCPRRSRASCARASSGCSSSPSAPP